MTTDLLNDKVFKLPRKGGSRAYVLITAAGDCREHLPGGQMGATIMPSGDTLFVSKVIRLGEAHKKACWGDVEDSLRGHLALNDVNVKQFRWVFIERDK